MRVHFPISLTLCPTQAKLITRSNINISFLRVLELFDKIHLIMEVISRHLDHTSLSHKMTSSKMGSGENCGFDCTTAICQHCTSTAYKLLVEIPIQQHFYFKFEEHLYSIFQIEKSSLIVLIFFLFVGNVIIVIFRTMH